MTDPWAVSWSVADPEFIKASEPEDAPKQRDELLAGLTPIFSAHGEYLDGMVASFQAELEPIVAAATTDTIAYLRAHLIVDGADIPQTAENLEVLRSADDLFLKFLDARGYHELLIRFTEQFGGQLTYLQQTVDFLAEAASHTAPALNFSNEDLNVLDSLKATTIASLDTSMEAAAGSAMQKIMFSVGGLGFQQLTETLRQALGGSVAANVGRADTAMTVWYRTATDRAFRVIEATAPAGSVRKYRYAGPDDAITRPFCHALLVRDEAYSRPEIEKMDNGQLPNVFLTGGGYRCRHQWLLDIASLGLKVAA